MKFKLFWNTNKWYDNDIYNHGVIHVRIRRNLMSGFCCEIRRSNIKRNEYPTAVKRSPVLCSCHVTVVLGLSKICNYFSLSKNTNFSHRLSFELFSVEFWRHREIRSFPFCIHGQIFFTAMNLNWNQFSFVFTSTARTQMCIYAWNRKTLRITLRVLFVYTYTE